MFRAGAKDRDSTHSRAGAALAPRVPIAGIAFDLIREDDLLEILARWIPEGRRGYVCLANPHSVMLARRDPRMRAALQSSSLTLPDGVGIVAAARLLGHARARRITGPDLMLRLCQWSAANGMRQFLYGGSPGIAERLGRRLSGLFPGLRIAGTYSPPFRALTPAEDYGTVERINAAAPHIVWVGLGSGKQERWMWAHESHISAPVMIGVGAAFDFHAGAARRAPAWARKCGLEWAHRLMREPKRLWRRNLDSPAFLAAVARDWWRAADRGT